MPDYEKLRQAHTNPRPIEPLDIFARLVKPDDIRDLSPAQAEVLESWFKRRNERDIVLKLNTGAGKTLIGLIAARSTMNEKGGSVLYLCPDKQLVDQTLGDAADVRIAAERYVSGNPLPPRFLSGEAILVATYAALFNGYSKFGVEGKINYTRVSMVILDDAHVELADLRDRFTVKFSSREEEQAEVYNELVALLRPYYRDTKPGLFEDIVDGKEFAVLELPYWQWFEVKDAVFDIVRKADRIEWPLIRDNFDHCHAFVGPGSVSITPIFPMTDMLPTFANAPRRLFMSATLADDSVLAATFALTREALKGSISSTSLTGVGERMMLVPGAHEKLASEDVHHVIEDLVVEIPEAKKGAVIIVPSRARAKGWTEIAPLVETSEKVAQQVTKMQAGKDFGPVVFANRYDGMDLKGDSCRLLVIDGLPQGRSDYETARGTALVDSSEIAASLAQRLEQGLGRGSRGRQDYCAVLLLGDDLVSWLSHRDHWRFMTASTRAQIAIGEDLTAAISDAYDFKKTILECVNHDDSWVTYYTDALVDRINSEPVPQTSDSPMMIERDAFEAARGESLARAIDILVEASSTASAMPSEYKGWFMQMAARYAWLSGDITESVEYQQTAHKLNKRLFRPTVEPHYEAMPAPEKDQAEAVLQNFADYRRGQGYVTKVEMQLRALNGDATTNQFEEALSNLGSALGFATERPDGTISKGPDVLWLTHARIAFVIEAKSKKHSGSALNKEEKGQLLNACEWFKTSYPNWSFVEIIALPEAIATSNASYGPGRALTFESLSRMRASLIDALLAIRALPRGSPTRVRDAADILAAHNLTPDRLTTFTEEFRIVKDQAGESVPLPLQSP